MAENATAMRAESMGKKKTSSGFKIKKKPKPATNTSTSKTMKITDWLIKQKEEPCLEQD